MADGRRPLGLALLVAAAALAGCAQPGPGDGWGPLPPASTGTSTAVEPSQAPRENLWLKDAPHPAWTAVSTGSEPFMLADRDGRFLWVGDTSGGYYSTDNGTTWSRMGTYAGNSQVVFRDGWVFAQDESSRLYAAVLHDNRVDVLRSSDGGDSWDQTTYAVGVSGTADRPWIAAQGSNVAMVYFDAPAVVTGLFEHCALSTDSGATFVDRNPAAGSPQGGNAVFDDQGNFYYGDNSGTVHRFPGTCRTPSTRAVFQSAIGPYNNMVPVAVEGDTLCMAAATTGNGAIQVGCMRDFGAPVVKTISPDFLQSNIFATISMHEGQIAVAWYGSETDGDLRESGFQGAFNVYVALVEDFWADEPRITHVRLTEEANHVGQICIGGVGCDAGDDRDLLDYFGIDHDKWGGIHVAYVHDGSGSSPQVRYAMVPATGFQGNGTPPPDPGAPFADFTYRVSGYDVQADAGASFDPQGQALTFAWDWGDGALGGGEEATHTYEDFGAYTVRLRASTEDGRFAEASANLVIDGTTSNLGPEARFAVKPSRPEAGGLVCFRDESTDDGSIESVTWRFGDGKASTSPEPSYAYAEPGNYTVTLEVTDDKGATDTFSGAIRVYPAGEGEPLEKGCGSAGKKGTPGPALGVLAAGLALAALCRRGR